MSAPIPPRRRPLRTAALVVAGWAAYAALFAGQTGIDRVIRGEDPQWARTVLIWLACAASWAVLTPGVLWLSRRFPVEPPTVARSLGVLAVGGLVATSTNLALLATLAPAVGAISGDAGWPRTFVRLAASSFVLDYLVYAILVGGAQTVALARAARERERRTLRLEARLSEARLLALRAQLQPHFLFNTLNTVAVLMREDVDAAERVLVKLSALLRTTLEASDAHEVPLREEIAFLETYLEIERTRFADRLSYVVDVDPAALDARVPSLILQPLVENAVKHGVARRASPGRVEVTAARRNGTLELTVHDDGPGGGADPGPGVGLANTRARLEQLYGADHRFEAAGAEGAGFTVSLAFPYRRAE